MATFVALLRGINVGGNNKLPMRELAALFADAGAREVATYIQSGNVVFDAPAQADRRIAAAVGKAIAARFGLTVPVVTRSAAELAAVIGKNPFLAAGKPEKALHVMFLADAPSRAQLGALDPARSPG